MRNGAISGWQLFFLGYFCALFVALLAAVIGRKWMNREARVQFEDLIRRRGSVYEMLKILIRESRELARRSDEDLAAWLAAGPSSWPEGQALRDVENELEILREELVALRAPRALGPATAQLTRSVDRAREWIGRVLGARSVEQVRSALASTADDQTRRELAEANELIRRFSRSHGIKEQDSFYHDSYFYV